MATIDSIQSSLRIAEEWERKGQPAWVSKCLLSGLLGYVQLAVTKYDNATSGLAWLAEQNVANLLKQQFDTLQALTIEVSAGRLPSSVIGGNYHPLVCAHVAWGLKEFDLGEGFVAFAGRKDVGELGTGFWREYARGMEALVTGEAYRPKELRLKGQERYWMSYLRLIEVECNGRNVDHAVAEIEKQFWLRNSDKTIKDDGYQIEGSGDCPVKWDFRRQSLLNYLGYRQH